jgi:hypothetical protein
MFGSSFGSVRYENQYFGYSSSVQGVIIAVIADQKGAPTEDSVLAVRHSRFNSQLHLLGNSRSDILVQN